MPPVTGSVRSPHSRASLSTCEPGAGNRCAPKFSQ